MAGPPRHCFSSQENGRGYNPGELSLARAFSFTYKKDTNYTNSHEIFILLESISVNS
jgi:hypothetical protein